MRENALNAKLTEMLGGNLTSVLTGCFEKMEWAEDEIEKAQRRHPAQADRIYHSFKLLCQADERMGVEMVYRGHCREILDRVAAGHDTRPGTAAEVCVACCEASALAPLTETAAGLYSRMWLQAFPQHAGKVWGEQAPHYEALRGSQIDDLEREARHKTAQADRKLGPIDCKGMHRGDEVACQYAAPARPVQLELVAV